MFKSLFFSFLILLSSNALAKAPFAVGSVLTPLSLNNQHDKLIKVNKDVKIILFAVEKAPSDVVNEFLMKKDTDFLVKNKAYFIADISGMPSLITSMFAIPKMKKRPYDILLVRGEQLAQVTSIPRKKEFVTLVKITDGKVTAVHYVNTVDQLAKVF